MQRSYDFPREMFEEEDAPPVARSSAPQPTARPSRPVAPPMARAVAAPPPRMHPVVRYLKTLRFQAAADTMPYLGTLGAAAYLWYLGAVCTFLSLSLCGINLVPLGPAQWLIPLFISIIEVLWMMRGNQQTVTWLVIVAIDWASSFFGSYYWLQGRELPIFAGVVMPDTGNGLILVAAVASTILTFAPEQAMIFATKGLKEVWRWAIQQ